MYALLLINNRKPVAILTDGIDRTLPDGRTAVVLWAAMLVYKNFHYDLPEIISYLTLSHLHISLRDKVTQLLNGLKNKRSLTEK